MESKAKKDPLDTLRQAIEKWPHSRASLCDETGVSKTSLSMFMRGHQGLGHSNIIALCKKIGLNPDTYEPLFTGRLRIPPAAPGAKMFTEVALPVEGAEIDIYPDEYALIQSLRGQLEPHVGLATVADLLERLRGQLPEGDVYSRVSINQALGLLRGLIQERQAKPKPPKP